MTLDDIRQECRREIMKDLRRLGKTAPPDVLDQEVELDLPLRLRRRIGLAKARISYLTTTLPGALSGKLKEEKQRILAEADAEVLELKAEITALEQLKAELHGADGKSPS